MKSKTVCLKKLIIAERYCDADHDADNAEFNLIKENITAYDCLYVLFSSPKNASMFLLFFLFPSF